MNGFIPTGLTEVLAGVVALLSTVGGFVYWLGQFVTGLATKAEVAERVEDEVGRVETQLDEAQTRARANETELKRLTDLLEGGASQFDRGVLDALEDDIERTDELEADLEDLRTRMRSFEDRDEDE